MLEKLLRRPTPRRPWKDRLLALVAKVIAPMHPTNPSGNNLSQR